MKDALLKMSVVAVIIMVVFMPITFVAALSINNVEITEVTENSAYVSWITDEPSDGIISYGETKEALDKQQPSPGPVNLHTVQMTALEPQKTYFFKITATAGNQTQINDNYGNYYQINTRENAKPSAPKGLKTDNITEGSVKLSWDANTDGDLKGYKLYRNNVEISPPGFTLTSFEDKGVYSGQSYQYYVTAFDTLGSESSPSAVLEVTTLGQDKNPPTARNIRIVRKQLHEVTFAFETDEASTAQIFYGLAQSTLDRVSAESAGLSHEIVLDQLSEADGKTTYYYKIHVCDKAENCQDTAVDGFIPEDIDTSTDDYSFTVFVNGKEGIPAFYNSRKITLEVQTKPYAKLIVYVDGEVKRIKPNIGEANRFTFNDVALNEPSSDVKIVSEAEGASEEISGTINLDMVAPVLEVQPIVQKFGQQQDINESEFTALQDLYLTVDSSVRLKGTVSEKVTLTITAEMLDQTSTLPTPSAPRKANAEENRIEIEWDEVDGASQYLVYRSDVSEGPIDITSATSHTDSQVSTDTTYTYTIAAVDRNDKVSGKSGWLTVKTLAGGYVVEEKPEVQNLRGGSNEPTTIEDVEGSFDESISIEEGLNRVTVTAEDAAGNTDAKSFEILLDSEGPEILETNLDRISPTYVSHVNIQGKISEIATVEVFVMNENGNWISKGSAQTDETGAFSFGIDLQRITPRDDRSSDTGQIQTADIGLGGTHTGTTDGTTLNTRQQRQYERSWENRIKIVATDRVGNQAETEGRVVYAICGGGIDWQVKDPEISPSVLIPRHMLLGLAEFGVNVGLEWRGNSQKLDPVVTSIDLDLMPSNMLSENAQNNYDMDWVRKKTEQPSPDKLSSYFLFSVDAGSVEGNTTFKQEQNLSEHHKGDCSWGASPMGCVKIPLMLTIQYDYKDREGKLQRATQIQCWDDVQISIDQRINPDFLPEGGLKRAVHFFNETINLIDNILEPIKAVTEYAYVACLGGWVAYMFLKAQEHFSCIGVNPKTCDYNDDEKCKSCYDKKQQTVKFMQSGIQWVCDRVICPPAPTIQEYIKEINAKGVPVASHCYMGDGAVVVNDRDLLDDMEIDYQNKKAGEDANCKIALEPRVLKAESGKSAPADDPTLINNNCCEDEYVRTYDSVAIGLNELEESGCLSPKKEELVEQGKISCGGIAKVSRTVGSVCSQREQDVITWADPINTDLCPKTVNREINTQLTFPEDKTLYTISDLGLPQGSGFEPDTPVTVENGEVYTSAEKIDETTGETTTEKVLIAKEEPGRGFYYLNPDGTYYTELNSYVEPTNPASCYWTADFRKGQGKGILYRSFVASDMYRDAADPQEAAKDEFARKSFSTGTFPSFENARQYANELGIEGDIQPTDIVFRQDTDECYSTYEEYVGHTLQDKRASQRGWELMCGGAENKYAIDPSSGIVRAIQSVCLSAITQYLNMYREMLKAVKNCFEAILITGDGDAGVCQAVLSVYVCDMIYYAIKCIEEKAAGDEKDGIIRPGIGGLLNSLSEAQGDTQNTFQGRYGDSNVYQVMFAERKLWHAVCIFAFTGDWTLNFDTVIQSESYINVPPTAVIYPAHRRFQSSDPSQLGWATFTYDFAVYIIAGSDVDYEIELICSDDNSCGTDIAESGRCDCAHPENAAFKEYNIAGGNLGNMESFNQEYIQQVNEKVRYDKVRITLRWVNSRGEIETTPVEIDIDEMGGKPPADCGFDLSSVSYHCSYDFGEAGCARFITDPSDLGATYYLGDPLNNYRTRIWKQSASSSAPENMYVGVRIVDPNNANVVLWERYDKITREGESELSSIPAMTPTLTNEFVSFTGKYKPTFTNEGLKGTLTAEMETIADKDDIGLVKITIGRTGGEGASSNKFTYTRTVGNCLFKDPTNQNRPDSNEMVVEGPLERYDADSPAGSGTKALECVGENPTYIVRLKGMPATVMGGGDSFTITFDPNQIQEGDIQQRAMTAVYSLYRERSPGVPDTANAMMCNNQKQEWPYSFTLIGQPGSNYRPGEDNVIKDVRVNGFKILPQVINIDKDNKNKEELSVTFDVSKLSSDIRVNRIVLAEEYGNREDHSESHDLIPWIAPNDFDASQSNFRMRIPAGKLGFEDRDYNERRSLILKVEAVNGQGSRVQADVPVYDARVYSERWQEFQTCPNDHPGSKCVSGTSCSGDFPTMFDSTQDRPLCGDKNKYGDYVCCGPAKAEEPSGTEETPPQA